MKKNMYLTLAALSTLALLAGCSSTTSKQVDRDGQPGEVVFPEFGDHDVKKKAVTPNRENLSRVRAGLNRRDMYNLLGTPHYHEIFRAREWDYIFRFQQDGGEKICQFKVVYDSDRIVRNFYWKPEECRAFAATPATATTESKETKEK